MTTELRKGRICPTPGCGTPAELDDLFCSAGCGHEFTAADPTVMLNADGTLHDPNQVDDQHEPAHADPALTIVAPSEPAVVPPAIVATVTNEPAPALPATPAVAAATPVQAPATDPAATTDTSGATAKLCYIEVSVDLEPRPLRPDDVVAPAVASAGYTLSGKSVPFGRMSPIIPIVGDLAVSRLHGYFHRTDEGGYELSCETDNFTEVDGVELQKGQSAKLKDGSQIKLGDFFLIVYHED